MRVVLLLAVAFSLASAPLIAAGFDSFNYPDGPLGPAAVGEHITR